MKLNFTISELCISAEDIPQKVADKLLRYHIIPMQKVRDVIRLPIFASKHSGYRTVSWEFDHDRDGTSQHTFRRKGAIDWTCRYFRKNKKEFLKLIIELTDYNRITVYRNFIHCDYKATPSGSRELYSSNAFSKWKLSRVL